MKISPLPQNEKERLEALKRYEILDTEPEGDFNEIVELASQICNTPIALITLLDETRQWFKAKTGIGITETHRDLAFCAHTIHENDIMLVPDASKDERFFDNPLVTQDPKIRFYAGMPLITNTGFKLGALCVIDRKTKNLTKKQLNGLRILGKQVIKLLDLRVMNLEQSRLINNKNIQLDEVFGRINEGFIMLDKNWRYTYANKHVGEIVHRDPQSLIGKNVWEEFPDAVGSATYQAFHKAMAEQRYICHIDYYEPLDLWKENRIYPSQNGISVFIRDISEQKKGEAIIQAKTENLERAEAQAKLGSWSVEVATGKRHWSKEMYRIFGLEPQAEPPDFIENPERIHPDDRQMVLEAFAKVRLGEASNLKVFRTNPAVLPLRYVLPSTRVILDDEGKPKIFEGTALDITDLKIAEAKYENLINAIDVIVWEADVKTCRFTYVSAQAEKILGYPTEQWINDATFWSDHIHPDDRQWAVDFCYQSTMKKDPYEFDYRMLTADNRTVWLHDRVSVLVEGDQPVSLRGILIDITDRKQTEKDLLESKETLERAEEHYRSIFENSIDGIYQSTPDGRFITANQSIANIFGYESPEELINSVNDIGTQLYADAEVRTRMKELLEKEGKAVGFELRAVKKSGAIIWIQVNIRAVFDSQEDVNYFEGTVKDITKQKNQEEEIIREKELAVSFVNSLPGVFYLFDSTGKYLRWNKNFETVTGYSDGEIATMHPLQLFDEDEKELLTKRIAAVFETGFGEVEANFLLKNKTKVPYYFNGWKIDYEGKTCLIGVGIDISERKKAETKSKDSENKLRAFFRSTPDASVLLGKNFEVLALNDAAFQLNLDTYGTELHNGDIFLDKIFPEVRSQIREFIEGAFQGKTNQGEFPIPNLKTGKSFWWLAVFMPAYDEEGNIFAVVANSTNVDKIKRAELKLKKQFEELQKTNHELDRFVYSVSHDLRAPLASILGLINLADMEKPSPVFGNYFALIRISVNRLDGFIKDILDYSRNSRTEVTAEKIDFQKLVAEVQDNVRLMDGAERLKTELKIDNGFDFYSDLARVSILFNNLFSNAIKYQDHHKPVSTICIHVTLSLHQALIKFSDNGIGIDEKHLPKIFNMFYRASENSKGSGLGLYIARETLSKLGGTVKVESELGLSTIFEITIPNSPPNK